MIPIGTFTQNTHGHAMPCTIARGGGLKGHPRMTPLSRSPPVGTVEQASGTSKKGKGAEGKDQAEHPPQPGGRARVTFPRAQNQQLMGDLTCPRDSQLTYMTPFVLAAEFTLEQSG